MKDPLNLDGAESKVKQEQVQQQQQEYKFIGSQKRIPGLKFWQYNMETDELTELDIQQEVVIGLNGNAVKKSKAQYNPKCFYFQALNLKNAQKKVLKIYKSLLTNLHNAR